MLSVQRLFVGVGYIFESALVYPHYGFLLLLLLCERNVPVLLVPCNTLPSLGALANCLCGQNIFHSRYT